jgi:hypothetical protein
MSGQLHAPAALPPVKEPQIPIGQETGWDPEPVWMLWSKERTLATAGNRTPAVQPVATPTELSRIQVSKRAVHWSFKRNECDSSQ